MAATVDVSGGQSKRVRLASKADVDHIWAIDNSATKKYGSIPELADLAVGEESPNVFEGWLERGHVYLIEDSSSPVGFIAVEKAERALYINEIAVHQDRQRGGLGAQLLSAAFDWARDLARDENGELASVSLATYPDVPWNGPWYMKHGFVEVDIEPSLFPTPHHLADEEHLARPGYRRCCMLWEEKVDS